MLRLGLWLGLGIKFESGLGWGGLGWGGLEWGLEWGLEFGLGWSPYGLLEQNACEASM